MYINKRKSEESIEQHLTDSPNIEKFPCFRCGRIKLKYLGARNCSYKKKANRSDINSKEVAKVFFKEKKEAKSRHRRRVNGSQYTTEGIVVLS